MEGALASVSDAALVAMRCRTSLDEPDTVTGSTPSARSWPAACASRCARSARRPPSAPADALAELARARGCLLEAGGQLDDALDAGATPILLAGDGAIALATLPTVARRRPDARVLWFDAHACFQVPDGAMGPGLERTALAGACGRWASGWPDRMTAERLVLCGVRAMDDAERAGLAEGPVRVIGTTLETLVHLQHALDGAPTYIHLDVDVLDEAAMPLAAPVPGGLTEEKLLDLLDAVADACEVVGIEVCGFAPGGAREAELAEVIGTALHRCCRRPTLDGGPGHLTK